MLRPLLAASALLLLAGCAELGYGGGNAPWDSSRYPSDRRAPTYDDRADDYRRSSEYRRVRADAADYARYVDRNLRLGSGQESAIRQIVERRAEDLLRRTRTRDHARVYPFPRSSGRNNSFWRDIDRDVEGRLDRRTRDEYRYLVRHGESRYRDQYRREDRRDDRGSGRDDGQRSQPGARRGQDQRTQPQRRGDDRRTGRDRDRDDDRRRGDDDDDDDRAERRRSDRDSDRAQRPGETLEEWYRRQARRPN